VIKKIKSYNKFIFENVNVDPYGEENWHEPEIRKPTKEESIEMIKKLKEFTYNYQEIVDNFVLLAYIDDEQFTENYWGKVSMDLIMDPSIKIIGDKHIQKISSKYD
jgi:hypothetical protein